MSRGVIVEGEREEEDAVVREPSEIDDYFLTLFPLSVSNRRYQFH